MAETTKKVEFNKEQMKAFQDILARYPEDRSKSALLPTLYLAQEAYGNITDEVMEYVAEILKITPAKVREVFTFYTYYRRPGTGKYRIDVCCTLSCAIRCSKSLMDHLEEKYKLKPGGTTEDGRFSLMKVECLAACGKAPALQINGVYHEDLTPEKLDKILEDLK